MTDEQLLPAVKEHGCLPSEVCYTQMKTAELISALGDGAYQSMASDPYFGATQ